MELGSYIAIEGPIGVGKTTLARRLAQSLAADVLAEKPEENPFLADFYANPRGYALQAQLSFLLQRVHQIDSLRQGDLFATGCVADFMFDKDPLFAGLNLVGAELTLYQQLYDRLAWQAPRPDCVIYLHAPVDLLLARVARRDRHAERPLQADYMARVVAAYARYFRTCSPARLISVDAAALDLVGNTTDYRQLLWAIDSGRHHVELSAATRGFMPQ